MEQLGRYIIQEEIGKGGMGIVYRAYDPEIDRKLALKVLRADMAEDEEIVQRFLREAKAAGRLAHPNIVTVYDVGEDGGMPFIAMEFLSGISLEEMIKQGPLPLRDALRFSGQIAHALHYAHREGVVHRDIKPSNIIVGGDGQVKITDFGIARVQDISSSEQTRTGQILGTPTYMSPEQVQGKKVNGSADLFSLGVILYEMISGERPFRNDSIVSLFHAILNEQPVPLSRKMPGVPEQVDHIVSKALEKDPAKRYATGEEFARALSGFSERGKTVVLSAGTQGKSTGSRFLFLGIVGVLIVGAAFFLVPKALHKDKTAVEKSGVVAPVSEEQPSGSAAKSEQGNINFKSDPPGASVFINGLSRGKTPLDIALDQGSYEVRLDMPGYLSWEAQINVEKRQTIPLEVELTPKTQ